MSSPAAGEPGTDSTASTASRVDVTAPGTDVSESRAEDSAPRAALAPRAVLTWAAVVVVVSTVVRTVVAASGWFYWDDLALRSQAAAHRLPDAGLLLDGHDGHLMPGGMLLVWIAAHVAPLGFWMPVLQMAMLGLLAGAALAWLLWVLLRGRAVLLVPLSAALLLPLGLPSATWWAAALTALPLSACLAWASASTLLLARTGGVRHAVSAVAATVVGLVFVEKAVLVPLVAAAVLAGWWWISDPRPEGRAVLRRTAGASVGQVVVLLAWAVVYGLCVGSPAVTAPDSRPGGAGVFGLVDHAYRLAVVPTLAGGPWRWARWHPGPPWADPSVAAIVAGALAGLGVLVWSLRTHRRTAPLWVVAALYPLLSVVAVALVRTGPDTAPEIMQTLRYHSDTVVVLAVAAGLALAAPLRARARARAVAGVPARALWAFAFVLLLLSSGLSTETFRRNWADQPSRDYLVPLVDEMRAHGTPMLDQPVPLEVLLPVAGPASRLGEMVRGVPDLPPVGEWTTDPTLVDAHGHLLPAAIVGGRTFVAGPEAGCGYRVPARGVRIPLDGPLLDRDWVVQVPYFSGAAGHVTARLDTGEAVTAPVDAGLGAVFVRLSGGGDGVTLTPEVPPGGAAPDLCIGQGAAGVLMPR